MKRRIAIVTIILAILLNSISAFAYSSSRCAESGCKNYASSSSRYCAYHVHAKTTCYVAGCESSRPNNSIYCRSHSYLKGSNYKPSNSVSHKTTYNKPTTQSKKKYIHDSYDDGYEAVSLDGDYDDDRYRRDSSYALGVDDAMDDEDWD